MAKETEASKQKVYTGVEYQALAATRAEAKRKTAKEKATQPLAKDREKKVDAVQETK